MLSEDFKKMLAESLGDTWVSYITNKKRGGNNGQKGTRFEDFFTAYKLAKELVKSLGNNRYHTTSFEQQSEAIVDDLVITYHLSHPSKVIYYQCKNYQSQISSTFWTSGKHSLADDFAAQIHLCRLMKQDKALTALVVSTKEAADILKDNLPTSIADHTEVFCFPYCEGKINRLVLESTELRGLLMQLTRVAQPTDDELVNTFSALMCGIIRNTEQATCQELLAIAQSMSPHLIRLMPDQVANLELAKGFEQQLTDIRELTYSFDRGFFHWEALGMSGVYPHHCLSEEFQHFQQKIIQYRPTTFDDLEKYL